MPVHVPVSQSPVSVTLYVPRQLGLGIGPLHLTSASFLVPALPVPAARAIQGAISVRCAEVFTATEFV